jgi:hypothetical protein
MEDRNSRHYRSLFWPIILIGIGVLWLMGNLNLLSNNTFNLLAALWPLLLVGAGLDLLFGRRQPIIGALIALLLVGAAAFVLVSGPSIGIQLPSGDLKVEALSAPLDGAKSATVNIESASQPVKIGSLTASDLLLDASISHYGTLDFQVSGEAERKITLRRLPSSGINFNPIQDMNARWTIALATGLPIDLRVDSASGSVEMDMERLQLSALSVDSGSGAVSMNLPPSQQPYTVEVSSASGAVAINMTAANALTARIDSGSGAIDIRVPSSAALRVEVQNGGSGSVNLPSGLDKIQGDADEDEGVWETSGYGSAQNKIEIILEDVGSGSVNIH